MTKKEKLKAIIQRLKEINVEIDPAMISCLVISKYLSDFQKANILEGELNVTERGLKVVSIAEEFEWKPTNKEIKEFVLGLINSDINQNIVNMMIEYRDNPVEFMEKNKRIS